jgi:DNA-binding NarL/FixJ family response regulator
VKKIRVLFADDHAVLRRGIRSLVDEQSDMKVVAEAANGEEAVSMALRTRPDVAILDINMPRMNGLEAARRILDALPKTEILILTIHHSDQVVDEVLESGAHGCVLKSEAEEELVETIRSLSRHKTFFSPDFARAIADTHRRSAAAGHVKAPKRLLTPREREVLQLLAQGNSNKQVADFLNISKKTAEVHRTNIMRKLEVHSLAEMVRYAIRNKLVEA